MFQSERLAYKSIPEVGSSSKTSFEPPHRAIVTESLRRLPPESEPACLFLSISSPTSLINFLISPCLF